jgi:hypothetical protein
MSEQENLIDTTAPRTKRALTGIEREKLVRWLKDNNENLLAGKVSRANGARQAARALGFKVTVNNLIGAAEICLALGDFTEVFYGVKREPTAHEKLQQRVEDLEAEVQLLAWVLDGVLTYVPYEMPSQVRSRLRALANPNETADDSKEVRDGKW